MAPFRAVALVLLVGPTPACRGCLPDGSEVAEDGAIDEADPSAPKRGQPRRFRSAAEGRPEGKWATRPPAQLTPSQQAEAERLQALGYLDATEFAAGAVPAIRAWDRARASDGLNLFTSGHAAEVQLLDMDGAPVHAWRTTWAEAFPNVPAREGAPGTHHFRRARLGADGTLFAVFEGRGMVALGADGTVRWASQNGAHHDLQLVDGGRTLVALVRRTHLDPRLRADQPVIDDAVVWIDAATGEERRRVSLWDALFASDLQKRIKGRKAEDEGDLLHANSVFVLDGSAASVVPAWTAGRVLVSLREPSLLVVLDPTSETIVWHHKGAFRRQHDAEVDTKGRLWVFDNSGADVGARVLALDPVSGETVWSYAHSEAHPLRSNVLGAAQQLPNGNVLVTESNGGRALEVTPEGETVWELLNPNRSGPDGSLVAVLFEAERIPRAALAGWTSPPDPTRARTGDRGTEP